MFLQLLSGDPRGLFHEPLKKAEQMASDKLNSFEGTAKIKTGMMIKVDANEGVICFLDK